MGKADYTMPCQRLISLLCKPGTALWLVPPMQDGQKIKTIMRAPVDKTHLPESSSSYPNLDPHITLASFPSSLTIPLSTIRSALPAFSSPVPVDFKSMEIGNNFFRSVFLAITPTPTLSALHDQIHSKLGIEARTPLFPHLSLAYIDDADAVNGERDRFVRTLEEAGKIGHKGAGHLALDCGGPGVKDWVSGFQATEVWIVECDGPVEEWTVLDRCSIVDGQEN